MKGQAFIDKLRQIAALAGVPPEANEYGLLADAVEIADDACRAEVETASIYAGAWWDTTTAQATLAEPLSYLERRGLVERREGDPTMVRLL